LFGVIYYWPQVKNLQILPIFPLRKLLTRARMGRSNLVLNVQPESPRKSALRSIATCARSMGACTPHTIPRIVVDMRKTEEI
jgi:hypothetical protein